MFNTVRLASVSLDESQRYGTKIEQMLIKEFPDEVEHVWTRTGTAEVATDPMGLELSDVFVSLRPMTGWKRAKTQGELVSEMAKVTETLPGMVAVYSQPIEQRINEMIAGIRADLGVKLFGDDLEILKAKAAEIEAVLKKVPGSADVAGRADRGIAGLESGGRSPGDLAIWSQCPGRCSTPSRWWVGLRWEKSLKANGDFPWSSACLCATARTPRRSRES